jgi:hypothetical protein
MYSKLCQKATNLLPPPELSTQKTHIYFLAGIPDITEKYTSTNPHYLYTECIHTEDPQHTIDRLKNDITHTNETILSLGAIPIFCTITHCNISMYNNFLLKRHKTSVQHHTQFYQDMHTRISHIIDTVNNFITATNRNNNMSTPLLHSCIKKKRGRAKKGYYIYKWDNLYDGLHGNDTTREHWARSLHIAITKNRSPSTHNSDTEENLSPKRSWKWEERKRKWAPDRL